MGAPEVHLGDNLVTFPTRKAQALLFYIAIEGGQQPREHLASLFWPESSRDLSYASLRNTLSRLQKALRDAGSPPEIPYLSITNQTLEANQNDSLHSDLAIIERAYSLTKEEISNRSDMETKNRLNILKAAADRYRGDFMTGFSLEDAPGFDTWVSEQREKWHRRLVHILDRLSEIQFTQGEFTNAIETISHWLALEPFDEGAYRRKMRAYFSAGDRAKSLETYDACREILSAELGIKPDWDTEALAERVRAQPADHHSRSIQLAEKPVRRMTSVDFLGHLFAGRNHEMQQLAGAYELAAAGKPQMVIIRGEAGIGKTRLASKFIAFERAQGAEILHGSAFESSSHFPYHPLVDAFRNKLEGDKTLRDNQDQTWFANLGQFLAGFKAKVTEVSRENNETPSSDGDFSQLQLFESLVQLSLNFAKSAPLIIFIDDIQWSDGATLDWLQYAARRWKEISSKSLNVRIMLVGSVRVEALQPALQKQTGSKMANLIQWFDRIEREIPPINLDLGPLDEKEAEELIHSILSPPSPEFAQWLYSKTRGHPFYLIETLKDLLERRVLRPTRLEEGQWFFSVNIDQEYQDVLQISSTIQTVIRSRLNRLSPHAFGLLAAAAVIEQQLTFDHLTGISNIDEDLALPALDELLSARLLLAAEGTSDESEYHFVNDMLRDVVYTEAGEARRRLFHRRAFELFTAEGSSEANLAHHALAAGLLQDAFHHSLAAGREALRVIALNEAIIHYEHALQLVREEALPEMPGEAEINEVYLQLGRIYELASQSEKSSNSDNG